MVMINNYLICLIKSWNKLTRLEFVFSKRYILWFPKILLTILCFLFQGCNDKPDKKIPKISIPIKQSIKLNIAKDSNSHLFSQNLSIPKIVSTNPIKNSVANISNIERETKKIKEIITITKTQVFEQTMLIIGRNDEAKAKAFSNFLFNKGYTEHELYNYAMKAGKSQNRYLKYHILSNLFENTLLDEMKIESGFQLTICSGLLGKYNERIIWSDYLLQNHGNNLIYRNAILDGKAFAYKQLKNYDKAIDIYKQELAEDYTPITMADIASCYYKGGDYYEAMNYAIRSLKSIEKNNKPNGVLTRNIIALTNAITKHHN